MALDAAAVSAVHSRAAGFTREGAIAGGLLLPAAPAKGTAADRGRHRTAAGEALLSGRRTRCSRCCSATRRQGRDLDRVQQELLTLAVPRSKAGALDFMRASTELAAAGTWQDPDSVSNDERADNVLLEVQFGETSDEIVGSGIVAALSVINNLEINEQVLYARMINVEESTLIS